MVDQRQPVRGRRPVLTERIIQVLRMVAVGLETEEIAFVLGVSQETVKTHLKVGLRALGVRNRREAVHVAHQRGIIR